MNTTITIFGTHCESCHALIRMELEDAGLDGFVETFVQDKLQTSILHLKDTAGNEERTKIVDVINNMEKYSAV